MNKCFRILSVCKENLPIPCESTTIKRIRLIKNHETTFRPIEYRGIHSELSTFVDFRFPHRCLSESKIILRTRPFLMFPVQIFFENIKKTGKEIQEVTFDNSRMPIPNLRWICTE